MHNEYEQITIEGYDKIAHHFDGTRRNFWKELEWIADYIPEHSTILDLGCGNGRAYEILKHKHITYIGQDASEGLLSIARARYPELRFIHSESNTIPLPDNSVDVVLSLALLHHLGSDSLEKTLSEIQRVLKPGGKAIITVWNIWKSRKRDILLQYARSLRGTGPKLHFGEILIPFSNFGNTRFVKWYSLRHLRRVCKNAGLYTLHTSQYMRSVRSENNIIIVQKKNTQ